MTEPVANPQQGESCLWAGELRGERLDVVSGASAEEFVDNYAIPGRPAVLRDVATEWPASTKWTWEFFRERYGSQEVIVKNWSQRQRVTTLTEFIDYATTDNGDDDPFYLSNWAVEKKHPELMADIEVPLYFENWLSRVPIDRRPSWHNFFMGGPGTGMPLHSDVMNTSAWLYLVRGRKEWVVFPPEDEVNLDKIVSRSDDGRAVGLLSDSWAEEEAGKEDSLLCQTHPYFHSQSPGEIMFFPPNWSHHVYNTEPSLSYSENFVNATNRALFKQYLEDNGMNNSLDRLTEYVPEMRDEP